MPTYAFRCRDCGPFDLFRPMADADRPGACPSCGLPSTRVFSGSAIGSTGEQRSQHRARELADRSAHEPAVLSAVLAARRAPGRSRDPRQARLPRP